MDFYTPPDNDEQRLRYEDTGGGTCGPAAIAALEELPVEDVIDRWQGTNGFCSSAPMGELEATLTAFGWSSRKIQGRRARVFPRPVADAALVRVQWALLPDEKEFEWQRDASHIVLMKRVEGDWWVFCNGAGWFPAHGDRAERYLSRGYVASYLELTKRQPAP